jgi:hypothetical protein
MRNFITLLIGAFVFILSTPSWGGGVEKRTGKVPSCQYVVVRTGILCVKAPCPSYKATDVSTGEQYVLNDVIFKIEKTLKVYERWKNNKTCLLVRGEINKIPYKTLWIREVIRSVEKGDLDTDCF